MLYYNIVVNTTATKFDLKISSLGSRTLSKEFGDETACRLANENGQEADQAVRLYEVQDGCWAITTNGDPSMFEDMGALDRNLEEWGMARLQEFGLDTALIEDASGQTNGTDHMFWICFAPKAEIMNWVEDLSR